MDIGEDICSKTLIIKSWLYKLMGPCSLCLLYGSGPYGRILRGYARLLVLQGVLCVLSMLWFVLLLSDPPGIVGTGCILKEERVRV